MDYISKLPAELYTLYVLNIDQEDRWRAYVGLLAIPAFARSLTVGRILDFMEICGVDVHVRPRSVYGNTNLVWYSCLEWTLNGVPHRYNGPACDYENGAGLYVIHGKNRDRDFVRTSSGEYYNMWDLGTDYLIGITSYFRD